MDKEKLKKETEENFKKIKTSIMSDYRDGGFNKTIKNKYFIVLSVIFLSLIILTMKSCGTSSSGPSQEDIKRGAAMVANITAPRYAISDFKIINSYSREINNEKVFIYETEFRIKDTQKNEYVNPYNFDAKYHSFTVGLTKRGNEWYIVR